MAAASGCKSSGSQAPKIAKKRVKPSPASVPVTPEVEVPPKASSTAKPDPKDVINLDDLPEDPTAESGKGDSGKGADAESQKAIVLLETRLKNYEEEIAKRPSIDALSAKVEVLEAENESLKNFMKESSDEENKKRKELLEKHAQEVSDLAEKLKRSHQRVQTLASKNNTSLGFEWTKDATLKRTEAYEEAQSSIDNLFEACRGVAKSLSLKRAGTAVVDTMTKLIKQVPELIKDWQESSAPRSRFPLVGDVQSALPNHELG
ncbi:hypothetical protein QYE76_023506 [Lolium multiflorum]|uniref:Uncharacterized protein n=1 Tax=Lolium multiflorum TaxID=4521 RepID=A0AAD8VSV0_LOLMU|nr:hypothetical protein QYE76_023506 [Lolium multiflorum]